MALVTAFDVFFRANYLGMVRYCAGFDFNRLDVEEVVADVIHRHYDEYKAKIESPNVDATMRRWMNRRAILDLRTRRAQETRQTFVNLDDYTEQALTFDDPEQILDVAQRLPNVPPVLIRYEPGSEDNKPSDRNMYCQEKKKFHVAFGVAHTTKARGNFFARKGAE